MGEKSRRQRRLEASSEKDQDPEGGVASWMDGWMDGWMDESMGGCVDHFEDKHLL